MIRTTVSCLTHRASEAFSKSFGIGRAGPGVKCKVRKRRWGGGGGATNGRRRRRRRRRSDER
jgi:hypothetical protein